MKQHLNDEPILRVPSLYTKTKVFTFVVCLNPSYVVYWTCVVYFTNVLHTFLSSVLGNICILCGTTLEDTTFLENHLTQANEGIL